MAAAPFLRLSFLERFLQRIEQAARERRTLVYTGILLAFGLTYIELLKPRGGVRRVQEKFGGSGIPDITFGLSPEEFHEVIVWLLCLDALPLSFYVAIGLMLQNMRVGLTLLQYLELYGETGRKRYFYFEMYVPRARLLVPVAVSFLVPV